MTALFQEPVMNNQAALPFNPDSEVMQNRGLVGRVLTRHARSEPVEVVGLKPDLRPNGLFGFKPDFPSGARRCLARLGGLKPGLRSVVLLLLMASLLLGCAAEKLSREGQLLIDEGRYEEGLARLQDAAKTDPDDISHRAAVPRNRERIAIRLLAQAASARAAGRGDEAQAIYERALKIDPDNRRAKDGLEALAMDQRHEKIIAEARESLKKMDPTAAGAALKPVLLENPKNSQAVMLQRQIDEQAAKELIAGPTLKAQFKKPVTLQFRDANLKMVFEALARVSGINVLLDKDVKPDLKTSIFVKDVSVEDTIELILMQSQLSKKIISSNTVFIYPNTPAKIKEYQELMIRSFHLVNADPKQMLTMLKTVLKTRDVFVNEKINTIVIRDTPDAILLAEKMIADQDIAEPEVMMEVEVLEVNRTRLTDIGVKWPDQLTLTAMGTGVVQGAATPTTTPTLTQLRQINSDNILTSPAMSVTLKAMLQDTDTKILASPRIRARNREKAKIMIGDRVPVITNAVTPVSTGAPVVTGNVQYLDVGLKLEVEPDIHLDSEVAIKINLDVSTIVKEVQNALSGTLAYQIGTRNASTLLQLKDGETQILAGLIDNQERNSASKVPGLGQLPVLGRLFSEHQGNGTKTEIVLSITPHIVGRMRQPDAREVEYWSGTEATLQTRPTLLRPLGAVTLSTSGAATPAVPAVPALPGKRALPKAAPEAPLALSWQGPGQAKVGDKISLTLNTQSAQGLKSLEFLVEFDPAVLKASDAVEGAAPQQKNSQPQISKTIDQDSGQILVKVSGIEPAGATASGGMVTIGFEVIRAAPQSLILASQIVPVGASGETLAFAAPGPYSIAVSP